MPDDELTAAWRAAKKATEKAKKAVLRAEERLREAQAQHLKMWDLERAAWISVRDAEWVTTFDRDGKPDGIRRVPVEGRDDDELRT